jgi:predicted O-methyltransferase YrrM
MDWSNNLTEAQIAHIKKHAIQADWFNYGKYYNEIALMANPPKNYRKFIELGTWKGLSIAQLATRIYQIMRNDEIEIYTVDDFSQTKTSTNRYMDLLYEIVMYNFTRLKLENDIKLLKMTSHEASKLFDNDYFDFVFIDADHAYEHVREDIDDWMPKIKKGGILAGHDYSPSQPGIRKAVDESFAGKMTLKINGVWEIDIK